MSYPDISVIITAYNSEKTLPRLLHSVVSQSLCSYEAILINDGSQDATGEICDEIARLDSRFKVIHQKNVGVALSRQRGMSACSGRYVIHFDSDDWVEPCLLEQMYNAIEKNNADLVICDYYVHQDARTVYSHQNCAGKKSIDVLKSILTGELHGSLCNKMVKRDTLKGCFFPPDVNYCEDVLLWTQVLRAPLKVAYLPEAYYHYDDSANPYSLTKRLDAEFTIQRVKYVEQLSEFLCDEMYSDVLQQVKLRLRFEAFLHNLPHFVKDNFTETNSWIFRMKTSLLNRICLYLSAKGIHCVGYAIYKLKGVVKKSYKFIEYVSKST